MGSDERFWRSRLRWRLRGATQWPTFAVATLLTGLILWQLPPLATRDLNAADGLLLAVFGNLVLVAAVSPFLTRRMMRRRGAEGPPKPEAAAVAEREVLQDRVGTLLLAGGVVASLVSGLANRPVVVSETRATEEVGRQARIYVDHSGSAELKRNLDAANTHRLDDGYFRVCIPRDDRRRSLCLYVDTNTDPTRVRRDSSTESNTEMFGLDDR